MTAAVVLLLVTAALTVVTVLAFLATVGPTSQALGEAIWACVPAVIAAAAAPRLARGSRAAGRWAVGACVLWVVGAVASLGAGDPRGLTQLVLPVVVLVLLLRPGTRAYLRG